MSESNTFESNTTAAEGYDLIGKVALETKLPEDEMIRFLVDIIKLDNIDPKTLSLEQLREVILNYLNKLN
ncbi:MAG: hypothetical protein ACRBBP_06390 [Bdellovibrionales bacterium]